VYAVITRAKEFDGEINSESWAEQTVDIVVICCGERRSKLMQDVGLSNLDYYYQVCRSTRCVRRLLHGAPDFSSQQLCT
jgi:hypothetical protein